MLIQQVVAFLLAGVLMTGGTAGGDLQDVPQDSWAYSYVSYIVEHDVMSTTKTGYFLGEVQINRGDFILSLWRAAGSPAGGSVDFSDVKQEDACYEALAWATQQGICQDIAGDAFSPAAYLKREEACVFLWRALPAFGVEPREGQSGGLLTAYALSLFGKRIPQDISLISTEISFFSPYSTPPQTTLNPDYPQLAGKAVEVFQALLSGEQCPVKTVLPYRLIRRESVR